MTPMVVVCGGWASFKKGGIRRGTWSSEWSWRTSIPSTTALISSLAVTAVAAGTKPARTVARKSPTV